jgi:hypothetical protein
MFLVLSLNDTRNILLVVFSSLVASNLLAKNLVIKPYLFIGNLLFFEGLWITLLAVRLTAVDDIHHRV